MKIALFTPSLEAGGAERCVINLSIGFIARQHQVDIVAASAKGAFVREVPPAARLIDLNAGRVFPAIPGLAGYLRREQPDILVCTQSHANVTGYIAHRLSNTRSPLVLAQHTTFSRSAETHQDIRSKLVWSLARRIYPRSDKVVAVSNGVKEDLIRWLGLSSEQVRVIYNPLVSAAMLEQGKMRPNHAWFAEGEHIPVILAAGRLQRVKRFDVLVRAFAQVIEVKQARLVIIGEGEERQNLESLAKKLGLQELLLMPGFQANPYAWMAHSAAFVLSSDYEGLPSVLVEAMAFGTPVVSTDCPSGPEEILQGGRFGALIPVGNVSGLTAGILKTLQEPLEADLLRGQAANFSLEKISEQYLDLFMELRKSWRQA